MERARLTENNLVVMVPTRGRRAQCERLLKSFTETATCADLVFVLDGDDQETYAGMDWGPATVAVLDPRDYLTGKLNKTAEAMADLYPVLMWTGDDNVFVTPGWDKIMLATLEDLGRLLSVQHDAKRDLVVPASQIVADGGLIVLTGANNPDGPPVVYRPTEIFDGGVAEKLNIPVAYLRRFIMANESEVRKEAKDVKDSKKMASLIPGFKFTDKDRV